jgi:hypothetical protein
MSVVTVEYRPALQFSRPQSLFDATPFFFGQQRNFDLALDGERFLTVKSLPRPDDAPSLVLLQHWFEELRMKAP